MSSQTDVLVERIRFGIDPVEVSQYTNAEVVRNCLNPAARRFDEKTLGLTGKGTIDAVAGTPDYALPASVNPAYAVERVTFGVGADRRPLEKKSAGQVIDMQLSAPGRPRYWYIGQENPATAKRLFIAPAPDADLAAGVEVHAFGGSPPYAEAAPATVEVVRPANHEDAIIEDARRALLEADWETGAADRAKANFADAVADVRNELERDRAPASRGDGHRDEWRFC